MKRPNVDVSLSSLKQELQQAQEQEDKRHNVNDSKLRAVAQHMDYDQFRQMVLGANLKCSKAGELKAIKQTSGEKSLNTVYRREEPVGETGIRAEPRADGDIETLTEFRRRWNGGERWEVLRKAASSFSVIFSRGIDCDYVAEIITIAHSGLVSHSYPCSVEEWGPIWSQLTQCNGFDQGLRMLSRQEKAKYDEIRSILG
jgi:hypothetical protein